MTFSKLWFQYDRIEEICDYSILESMVGENV